MLTHLTIASHIGAVVTVIASGTPAKNGMTRPSNVVAASTAMPASR